MFIQRALVALFFGPLALLLIYFGDQLNGLVYFVPFALLLLLATIEYVHLAGKLGWRVSVWLLLPLAFVQWALAQWGRPEWVAPSMLVSMFVILAAVLWSYEKQTSTHVATDWMALMGGVLVMGWLGGHFFSIRGLPLYAWQWTAVTMLTTWMTDSGAYLVGKFVAGKYILGKHKMSPRLSPNKTIEGFFGGVFFGVAICVIIGSLLNLPLWPLLILGFTLTLLTPLGDLSISLLKREAGVKDSGNLLPGHGGALDRVDTLLWAVAIGYYLALLLPQLQN